MPRRGWRQRPHLATFRRAWMLRGIGLVCLLVAPRAAIGVDVLLRWTVPPETDLAGYQLYVGDAPRDVRKEHELWVYQTLQKPKKVDLWPGTTVGGIVIVGYVMTIPDPQAGPSYVAVKAVNLAGLKSDYS